MVVNLENLLRSSPRDTLQCEGRSGNHYWEEPSLKKRDCTSCAPSAPPVNSTQQSSSCLPSSGLLGPPPPSCKVPSTFSSPWCVGFLWLQFYFCNCPQRVKPQPGLPDCLRLWALCCNVENYCSVLELARTFLGNALFTSVGETV